MYKMPVLMFEEVRDPTLRKLIPFDIRKARTTEE